MNPVREGTMEKKGDVFRPSFATWAMSNMSVIRSRRRRMDESRDQYISQITVCGHVTCDNELCWADWFSAGELCIATFMVVYNRNGKKYFSAVPSALAPKEVLFLPPPTSPYFTAFSRFRRKWMFAAQLWVGVVRHSSRRGCTFEFDPTAPDPVNSVEFDCTRRPFPAQKGDFCTIIVPQYIGQLEPDKALTLYHIRHITAKLVEYALRISFQVPCWKKKKKTLVGIFR